MCIFRCKKAKDIKVEFFKSHVNGSLPKSSAKTGTINLILAHYSTDNPKQTVTCGVGLGVSIPKGHAMIIIPHPNIANTNYYIPTSPIILIGNHKDISFELKNRHSKFEKFPFEVGEPIAQFIIVPVNNVVPYLCKS